jgi:hypothetical protein
MRIEKEKMLAGELYDPRRAASKKYCWYSWPPQAKSMARLADYASEWVLPSHGQRVHLPAAKMREQILHLAGSMHERSRL